MTGVPAPVYGPKLRGRGALEISSLFVELSVAAATTRGAVFVNGHESSGSAFGTNRFGPDDLVALDAVSVFLLNCFLLSGFLCCHLNHS